MWRPEDDEFEFPSIEPVRSPSGDLIGQYDRAAGQISLNEPLTENWVFPKMFVPTYAHPHFEEGYRPPTPELEDTSNNMSLSVQGTMVYNTMGDIVGVLEDGNVLMPYIPPKPLHIE